MTAHEQPGTDHAEDQRTPREDDHTPDQGGPGKTDMTGAGSGRMTTSGVEESSEDEHAQDRGAGKDGPTPNPAILAP